jgi:hypothetical protein
VRRNRVRAEAGLDTDQHPPQPARSLAPGGERCKRPQRQRYQDQQHQEPAPAQGQKPWAQALRQLEKLVRLQGLLKVVRGDAEGHPHHSCGNPGAHCTKFARGCYELEQERLR